MGEFQDLARDIERWADRAICSTWYCPKCKRYRAAVIEHGRLRVRKTRQGYSVLLVCGHAALANQDILVAPDLEHVGHDHRPGEPLEAEADGIGESRVPRFGRKR